MPNIKLHDLTEEQVDKLCEYIRNRDSIYDENGKILNLWKSCKNCPFSFYIGELDCYDCAAPNFEAELPEEFEVVIK